MMKPTLAILVALACTSAYAEAPAVPAQAKAAVTALPAPAARGSEAGASKPTLDTNPFTGKPMSVEQVQRELEESKLYTQMLEERLKQTNLKEELGNVPLRKAVEAAQARTAVRKEELGQADLEEVHKAAQAARAAEAAKVAREAKEAKDAAKRAAAPTKKVSSAKSARGAAPSEESSDDQQKVDETVKREAAAAPAPVRMAARPVLTSVMDVAGSRSAILELNGATLVARDGDLTPFGPLKVVDATSVNLNGTVLTVHGATLSRFVVSDPKPVEANKNPSSVAPLIAPAQPTAANNTAAPAPTGQQRMTLPPLQLPPGVNVLPASGR